MRQSLLFLPILLIGCQADGGDAAGIESVPMLGVTEDLRIDAEAADLVPLNTMLVRSDGALLFDQASEGMIKVLMPDGTTASIGRPGEGPGEFRSLARIGWLHDSVWAFDVTFNRITVFSPEFELVRTIEAVTRLFTRTPGDTVEIGAFGALVDHVYPDGDVRLRVTRNPQRPAGSWLSGLDSGYSAVLRTAPDGEVHRRIAVRPPDPCSMWIDIGGGRARYLRPFCRHVLSTDWSVHGGYAVVRVGEAAQDAPRYFVTMADSDGTVAFERSISYTPIPVSETERDSVRRRLVERNAGLPAEVLESMLGAAEAYHSPLRDLLLGRDGSVWLEEHSLDPGHHWLILTPTGEQVGRVTVPPNFRLMVAELGTIWGLEADEDGLESIVRYRVR